MKIVSGLQNGAERLALEWTELRNVPIVIQTHADFVSESGETVEDFQDKFEIKIISMHSGEAGNTEKMVYNILHSHVTLIFVDDSIKDTFTSKLIRNICYAANCKYIVIPIGLGNLDYQPELKDDIIVNITGETEFATTGAKEKIFHVLDGILGKVIK